MFSFIDDELLPYLKKLEDKPGATPRQKVISEIMSGVERTRIDTEKNFLDVLDRVHSLSDQNMDATHVFPLSQVYEGLLLKMGEKGNDGGQFFTPREIIRAMVRIVDPKVGETVYDPGCGTGGFLAQAYEHTAGAGNAKITSAEQLETLKRRTFYGREKDNAIYPIALANLVLHNIDEPHVLHGNTLTDQVTYEGLFADAPALFDVILMNPPFGGKEGKEAQTRVRVQDGGDAGALPPARDRQPEAGWAVRHRAGRGRAVPHQRDRVRPDETEAARRVRSLLHRESAARTFVNAGAGVKATCSSSRVAGRPSASGTTTSPT